MQHVRRWLSHRVRVAPCAPGVDDITAVVIILLEGNPKDKTWAAAQKLMNNVDKFLERLHGFKSLIDQGQVGARATRMPCARSGMWLHWGLISAVRAARAHADALAAAPERATRLRRRRLRRAAATWSCRTSTRRSSTTRAARPQGCASGAAGSRAARPMPAQRIWAPANTPSCWCLHACLLARAGPSTSCSIMTLCPRLSPSARSWRPPTPSCRRPTPRSRRCSKRCDAAGAARGCAACNCLCRLWQSQACMRHTRACTRAQHPAQVAELNAKVQELEAQFNAAVEDKEAAIRESERCQLKLQLANRLINALASEGVRGVQHCWQRLPACCRSRTQACALRHCRCRRRCPARQASAGRTRWSRCVRVPRC